MDKESRDSDESDFSSEHDFDISKKQKLDLRDSRDMHNDMSMSGRRGTFELREDRVRKNSDYSDDLNMKRSESDNMGLSMERKVGDKQQIESDDSDDAGGGYHRHDRIFSHASSGHGGEIRNRSALSSQNYAQAQLSKNL